MIHYFFRIPINESSEESASLAAPLPLLEAAWVPEGPGQGS